MRWNENKAASYYFRRHWLLSARAFKLAAAGKNMCLTKKNYALNKLKMRLLTCVLHIL